MSNLREPRLQLGISSCWICLICLVSFSCAETDTPVKEELETVIEITPEVLSVFEKLDQYGRDRVKDLRYIEPKLHMDRSHQAARFGHNGDQGVLLCSNQLSLKRKDSLHQWVCPYRNQLSSPSL